MKNLLVFCLFATLGYVFCKPGDTYTTKYDHIDIDTILKSDRLLNNYVNCLLSGEACTPDGHELRKHLPDAIENGCVKCSEKQKLMSKKVLNYILKNKPELFKKVEAKYDPEGVYKRKYKDELLAEGIVLDV